MGFSGSCCGGFALLVVLFIL
ncbi:YjcZ family sporulation protein [Bacillus toyonensis]